MKHLNDKQKNSILLMVLGMGIAVLAIRPPRWLTRVYLVLERAVAACLGVLLAAAGAAAHHQEQLPLGGKPKGPAGGCPLLGLSEFFPHWDAAGKNPPLGDASFHHLPHQVLVGDKIAVHPCLLRKGDTGVVGQRPITGQLPLA